jgi:hypothetical protein
MGNESGERSKSHGEDHEKESLITRVVLDSLGTAKLRVTYTAADAILAQFSYNTYIYTRETNRPSGESTARKVFYLSTSPTERC